MYLFFKIVATCRIFITVWGSFAAFGFWVLDSETPDTNKAWEERKFLYLEKKQCQAFFEFFIHTGSKWTKWTRSQRSRFPLRNSHTKCMDIARRKRTDGYRWLLSRDCNHWSGFFYHNKQTYWQQKELFWAFESIENAVLMEVQGLPRSAPQITHRCIPAEKEMTHKPC